MHVGSNATLKVGNQESRGTRTQLVRVVCLGPGAEEALAAGSGRVLSVFERCLYLGAASGAIACLGVRELGDGPLQLSLGVQRGEGWRPADLRVGDTWCYAEAALVVSGRQRFDLAGARSWRPTIVALIDAAVLGESLDRLSRLPSSYAPDAGLGYLVPDLAAIAAGGAAGRRAISRFGGRYGSDPVGRMAEALLSGLCDGSGIDEGRLPEVAHGLLGLGPGLTPSGDDFVGGLLVALRQLGAGDLAERICGRILPESPRLTNVISAAHLRWAARGIGGSALHASLNTLCQRDRDAQDASLWALRRVGHSSGWDALAGAVLGCALWSIR